jgi:two-component system, chemotaxis family, CheB/CheR fusion protein
MAKENLVLPLRRVIRKAAEGEVTVRETVRGADIDPGSSDVVLEVTPVPGTGPERCFLIVFATANEAENEHAAEVAEGAAAKAAGDHQVDSVTRELAETREYLRQMTEQYEAHAEELKAANEEARSANEELQSTNEELGTTKEELQSANEELTTVNEELQNRNHELGSTNSDLKNLLSAVTLAIIMVDQDLRIRRFNTAAEKLLQLGSIDIGRPIGHLRGRVETPRLEAQVKRVIDTLSPALDEAQDQEGRWYSISVRPYRTIDDRISGAIITFQDIDALKRGLDASEEARQYAEALIETVREPLVVLDSDLRVQRATSAFYETFMVSRDETEGRFLYDLGNGQWNRSRLRELLGNALFRAEPFHDFEVEHDFPHIGRRSMCLNARRIPRRDERQRTVLLAIEDVTERRELAEIRFQRLFETAKDGILVVDAETETVQDVNQFLLQLGGLQRHDLIGKSIRDASLLLGLPDIEGIVPAAEKTEIVRLEDLELSTSHAPAVPVEIVANRYVVGSRPVVQLNLRDISARKQSEKALKESEERFRQVVESVRDYAIFQLDGHGNILTWNAGAERLLGWPEREAIGMSSSTVFTPEDVATGEYEKELAQARTEGRAEDERWHMRKDGSRFFASGILTRVDGTKGSGLTFTKVMRDVTARMEQEERLRQSLEEKSNLVREIHHRVKNNLQIIVSLLNLQSHQTRDPQVLAAFEETRGRVHAISQIHEQLYASEDLREVEVGTYLKALAGELVALHSTNPGDVRLQVSVPKMVLPIEKAIPLGLIANELIVNSLKHGLRERTGNLAVTLEHLPGTDPGEKRPESGPRARLCVHDSGPGFPTGFDVANSPSMGYRLVNVLLRQLRAEMKIAYEDGALVTIIFPIPPGRTGD